MEHDGWWEAVLLDREGETIVAKMAKEPLSEGAFWQRLPDLESGRKVRIFREAAHSQDNLADTEDADTSILRLECVTEMAVS